MDVKELLEPLARYIEFLIDLAQFHGMEKYTRLESISPSLLLFCVFGIFIAYLISVGKRAQNYDILFEHNASNVNSEQTSLSSGSANERSSDPVDKYAVAQFVLLSLIGALLIHGFLIIYSDIFGAPKIYSVRDTLNGVLAYNAFYHPLNAFSQRILRGMSVLKGLSIGADALIAMVYFLLLVVQVGFLIYFLYSLAAVHGESTLSMALPAFGFVVVVLTLFILFFKVVGIPAKTLFRQVKSAMDDNFNSHTRK